MDKRSELHSRCLSKIVLRHTYSFVYTNKTAIASNGSISNIYFHFCQQNDKPRIYFPFSKKSKNSSGTS